MTTERVAERKLVTILFADLVGSTAIAEDEDPERVRARLEVFYDAMAEEIVRAGGTVEKFAGDAVMAVFGAPTAHEDDAERALHAALAMQRRLGELFGGELALRIGVNTGEVAVGPAREGSSLVSGDAVNVAARLEQGAAAGEILAGERTAAAVRGAFELDDERAVAAKGKAQPVRARPVLRALTLARPRGIGGLAPAFVGREPEIDLLRATFQRVTRGGEPHLVTIMGDAGVGKTRLVRELWEVLAAEAPEPLRRTGRCLPYGRGITYWPVGEILKEHFGLLESDSPAETLRRLAGREALASALGLDVSAGTHPLAARERLNEAFVAFCSELAASRPAVVLIEDLHWAEDDLLDLIERVHGAARGPLLLLGTARPELLRRRAHWGGGRRNTAAIWLEPLGAADAQRLLDELFGASMPAEIRELVAARAEGNPFFVEELVRSLIDAGVVEREADGWSLRDAGLEVAVPDSVQAVLAARIDLLPPLEKEALQAAAVVGRVFWRGPLVSLLGGSEPDLGLLEERDFVRRRPGSSFAREEEYAIKHALTREVAYASIPKARRARLHASLAEWLDREAASPDEVASLLAHHYAEAVRPEDADLAWREAPEEAQRLRDRARVWLSRAAELAQARYEMSDAIELMTRALELTDSVHERALLWRRIGIAQALRFDGEAFWTAMLNALEDGLSANEQADVYSLLAFHTATRSGMWAKRPDAELVDGWIDRTLELAPDGSPATARALVARANWSSSRAPIEQAAREAEELTERIGDIELHSYALATRAGVALDGFRFPEAMLCTERRLELVPRIDDLDHLTEVYESAVPVVFAVGRFDQAERLAGEHETISRSLSPHHRVHSVGLVVELGEGRGAWEEVAGRTGLVVDRVSANLATPCVRNARTLLVCGLAHAVLGDEARARELESDAGRLTGEGYDFTFVGPRLRLALLRGDLEAARILAEPQVRRTRVFGAGTVAARLDAFAALRDTPSVEHLAPPLLQPGTYVEPFAVRALGIVRGDDDMLARADERFEALGLHWHAAQTGALARR
jgi:class 3 adenylate cyclase